MFWGSLIPNCFDVTLEKALMSSSMVCRIQKPSSKVVWSGRHFGWQLSETSWKAISTLAAIVK